MKPDKSIAVNKLQAYLDAENLAEVARKAAKDAAKALDAANEKAGLAKLEVLGDIALVELLKATGIRTLDNKVITLDKETDVINVADFIEIPAIWGFSCYEQPKL